MNTSKPEYIKVNIDTEVLNTEMEGEEFLKESTGYIVCNTIKDTTNAFYIEGCVSTGVGISKAATSIIAESSSSALKIAGASFIVVGAIVGITCGGYFTNKYCEEIIQKFENFYLNNAQILANSYKQAAEFLLQLTKNE